MTYVSNITHTENLPFKEWQSKAKRMPVEEGAAALNVDRDYFPPETTDLLIYPGDCYIEEMEEGGYYLLIGNQDWQSYSLTGLEQTLYENWYAVQ